MDDLEMTKLCAEAEGFTIIHLPTGKIEDEEALLSRVNALRIDGTSKAIFDYDNELITDKYGWPSRTIDIGQPPYDPLHDDAQAMALVKKCRLSVMPNRLEWKIAPYNSIAEPSSGSDLNRAIVECVAKMMAARTPVA